MVNKLDIMIKNFLKKLIAKDYDSFINNNDLVIIHNGFVSSYPINNIQKLLEDIDFPVCDEDMINIIIANHNIKKNIKDGKYDNLKPMIDEEINNIFDDILNKKRT